MISNPINILGEHKDAYASGAPSTGTWKIGDTINVNTGTPREYRCTGSGTFTAFSIASCSTFNALPNVLCPSDISGARVGFFVNASAGFATLTGMQILSLSNNSGATASDGSSTNGSRVLSTANASSFSAGDYVTLSAGWASTTYPYRVVSATSSTLLLETASNSTQTGITITQVRSITVSSNANSSISGTVTISTSAPTFSDTIYISDTTDATAADTGSLQTKGGLYVAKAILLGTVPPEYADDAAAASGGLAVGGIYRTGSALKVRVS